MYSQRKDSSSRFEQNSRDVTLRYYPVCVSYFMADKKSVLV